MNDIITRKILSPEECSEVLILSGSNKDQQTGDYDVITSETIENKIKDSFHKYLKDVKVPNLYMYKGSRIQCTNGNIPLHSDLELYRGQHYLRHFTVLVSLNGDEIEGGQLVFPTRSIVIKPETGMLIIFPIGVMFPHQVLPCYTETKRYMLEQWHYFDYDNHMYGIIHERPTEKYSGPLL